MKMSEFNRSEYYENTESLQSYILRVLTKMGLGLAVTAAIAYACYYSLISYGIMYTFMIDMYPVSTIGMLVYGQKRFRHGRSALPAPFH